MSEISVDAAAASLNEIIDQLSVGGQPVVVTRDGKPVAQITRAADAAPLPATIEKRRQTFEDLRVLRDRISLRMTHDEIKAAIQEGRE